MQKFQLENEFTKYFNLVKRYRKRNPMHSNQISLTKTQGKILGFIASKLGSGQKVYQRDIEKEFTIRRSTATEVLKILESEGYIVRSISTSDARLKDINLTKKGTCCIQSVNGYILSFLQAMFEGITMEELEKIYPIMQKINNNLEKLENNDAETI